MLRLAVRCFAAGQRRLRLVARPAAGAWAWRRQPRPNHSACSSRLTRRTCACCRRGANRHRCRAPARISNSASAAEPPARLQAGVLTRARQSFAQGGDALPAGSWSLEPVQATRRWMVYMGPFADEDTLAKRRNELRAIGVAYDRPGAALEPACRWGAIPAPRARCALSQLGAQGVRKARVVQERGTPPVSRCACRPWTGAARAAGDAAAGTGRRAYDPAPDCAGVIPFPNHFVPEEAVGLKSSAANRPQRPIFTVFLPNGSAVGLANQQKLCSLGPFSFDAPSPTASWARNRSSAVARQGETTTTRMI